MMASITFETIKCVKKLKEGGVPEAQSKGQSIGHCFFRSNGYPAQCVRH